MTREEAKEIFINRGYVNVKGGIIFDGNKWRQSVKVITKWLKEQSCEDTISRQMVLDKWDELSPRGRTEFDQVIMMMPSITYSEKPNRSGEWLHQQLIPDDVIGHIHGECSCCHKVRIVDNYCPNCGAKMTGGFKKFLIDDVLAWMPQPHPYKAESEVRNENSN